MRLLFPFLACGRFLLCMAIGAGLVWGLPALTRLAIPNQALGWLVACLVSTLVSLPLLWRAAARLQRRCTDPVAPVGVVGGVLLGVNVVPYFVLALSSGSFSDSSLWTHGFWLVASIFPLGPLLSFALGNSVALLAVNLFGVFALFYCASGRRLHHPSIRLG